MNAKIVAQTSGESVLERLKALDAERASLIEGAKQEAIDKGNQAVVDLKSLGIEYTFVPSNVTTRAPRAPRKTETTKQTRQLQDKPCPICNFKTTPPHDARAHRGQKTKAPFTVEELMTKKLSRVG
jgi:hypothetical protein